MLDGGIKIGLSTVVGAEHLGEHLLSRESRKREWANKFLRRTGHYDLRADTAVLQQAKHFRRLVCCDAAGNAEGDVHECLDDDRGISSQLVWQSSVGQSNSKAVCMTERLMN